MKGSRKRVVRRSKHSKKSKAVKSVRKNRKSRMSRKSKRVNRFKLAKDSVKMKKMLRKAFGMVAGPGYVGQTGYSTKFAPYFGAKVPFVTPPGYWPPVALNKAQLGDGLFDYKSAKLS